MGGVVAIIIVCTSMLAGVMLLVCHFVRDPVHKLYVCICIWLLSVLMVALGVSACRYHYDEEAVPVNETAGTPCCSACCDNSGN